MLRRHVRKISVIWRTTCLLASPAVLLACSAGSGEPISTPSPQGRGLPETRSSLAGDLTSVSRKNEPSERSVGLVAAALDSTAAERPLCRRGMVSIEGRYCIDRYEASLVEVLPSGEERPFSPYSTIGAERVRAVSEPNVYPQGYVSAVQAQRACVASGKRLCKTSEWQHACRGPQNLRYGYAEQRDPGRCNDNGKNPVLSLFGPRYDASTMNQPRLNQLEGTLARTGEHDGCSNGYGVYDMVGNLHEWIADPNGTFFGGYYQDVASMGHGDGCGYQTTAHEARYHDYSTGFRCCADIASSDRRSAHISPPVAKPAKAVKPPRTKRR